MRIELPWPDKRLSSNYRGHWAPIAKAKKAARHLAKMEVLAAYYEKEDRTLSVPRLSFTYHPPNNLRRDAHNMPHMLKAHVDGIADALGIDDSLFKCIFPGDFADVHPQGKVVIEITEWKDTD